MQLAEKHALSEAEYLALEEAAPLRHEYVGGEAYAMSGGTLRHNRITANTLFTLMSNLKGKPCQVFMNDVKLHVARDHAYYYPDVMVTCSEQATAANESQVVSDPVLVVEVLSPSTEATDRREKLAAYRHLPSLQEYALISQDTQQVEIYRRQGDTECAPGSGNAHEPPPEGAKSFSGRPVERLERWLYITYEPGDTVEFAGVGVTLPISDLYAGTDIAT